MSALFWCPWSGLNARPLPYQGSALPLSYMGRKTSLPSRRARAVRVSQGPEAELQPPRHTFRNPCLPQFHFGNIPGARDGCRNGAGEGNRTLVVSLEGFCSTIELHPRAHAPPLGCSASIHAPHFLIPEWWRGKDSNLRRQSRQIYSLLPLTAREPLRETCDCSSDHDSWSNRHESCGSCTGLLHKFSQINRLRSAFAHLTRRNGGTGAQSRSSNRCSQETPCVAVMPTLQ